MLLMKEGGQGFGRWFFPSTFLAVRGSNTFVTKFPRPSPGSQRIQPFTRTDIRLVLDASRPQAQTASLALGATHPRRGPLIPARILPHSPHTMATPPAPPLRVVYFLSELQFIIEIFKYIKIAFVFVLFCLHLRILLF